MALAQTIVEIPPYLLNLSDDDLTVFVRGSGVDNDFERFLELSQENIDVRPVFQHLCVLVVENESVVELEDQRIRFLGGGQEGNWGNL
jgi:hypothetical protein